MRDENLLLASLPDEEREEKQFAMIFERWRWCLF